MSFWKCYLGLTSIICRPAVCETKKMVINESFAQVILTLTSQLKWNIQLQWSDQHRLGHRVLISFSLFFTTLNPYTNNCLSSCFQCSYANNSMNPNGENFPAIPKSWTRKSPTSLCIGHMVDCILCELSQRSVHFTVNSLYIRPSSELLAANPYHTQTTLTSWQK